jgi:hypothetical protein
VDNYQLLVVSAVVISTLIIGFIFVPYLKKTGLVKENDAEFTDQLLQLVELVVSEVKFENDDAKQRTMAVIKIAEASTRFVQDMLTDKTKDKRIKIAIQTSIKALEDLGVEVTDARKGLIELTVTSFMGRIDA